MKERPILFSAPMVRAILEGRKTQTRRVVKPQPPAGHNFAGFTIHSTRTSDEGKAVWGAGDALPYLRAAHRVRCPYGQPGDRLWVRETWARDDEDGALFYRADVGLGGNADDWERNRIDGAPRYRWRSPIHMPRWASRITLEITGVRVERLQCISDHDAIAEGAQQIGDCDGAFVAGYRNLWESINGAGSWDANPFVWVVEFKAVTP